jgi:hypothetical protein
VKGFKNFHISNAVDETDDLLWNGTEEDGNVRTVRKMEKVLLIGRGR